MIFNINLDTKMLNEKSKWDKVFKNGASKICGGQSSTI